MTTKHKTMPRITAGEIAKVTEAIEKLPRGGKTAARDLAESVGSDSLCTLLHAMRRWYSYNCWNNAKKIIPHREELHDSGAMRLNLHGRPSVTLYRGFKVNKNSDWLDGLDEGDLITVPVERNGGCSSWTENRDIANRFSGASQGKVGLVIKLADVDGVEPFIAPPNRSAAWFNQLYENTMNRSFRFNEKEWAVYASELTCRVVAVKWR